MKYFFILFTFFLIISGCRKPEENPELRDPIVRDLQQKLKEAEANLKTYEAEYVGVQQTVKNASVNTRELKEARKNFYSAEKKLRKAQQMVHYYQIKVNLRTIAGRTEYIKTFKEEKEFNWPDPNAIRKYNINNRVHSDE